MVGWACWLEKSRSTELREFPWVTHSSPQNLENPHELHPLLPPIEGPENASKEKHAGLEFAWQKNNSEIQQNMVNDLTKSLENAPPRGLIRS